MNTKRHNERAESIERQLKILGGYKGTEKLIKKYKTLIERQEDGIRKGIVIDKSPRIIGVFVDKVNPALHGKESENVFDSRAAVNAAYALKLFGRLVEKFPDNSIADDYVNMISAMGNITSHRYTKIAEDSLGEEIRLQPESIISIIESTFGIIETWELNGSENTMAKLQMLEWSVNRASRTVLLLDGNDITDIDENSVRRLHSTRNELVFDYLNRGLTALGESGNLENLNIIKNLFEKLDYELEDIVESHQGNENVTELVRDLNTRISHFIIEHDSFLTPVIVEALIRGGVRGVEHILEEFEKGN